MILGKHRVESALVFGKMGLDRQRTWFISGKYCGYVACSKRLLLWPLLDLLAVLLLIAM